MQRPVTPLPYRFAPRITESSAPVHKRIFKNKISKKNQSDKILHLTKGTFFKEAKDLKSKEESDPDYEESSDTFHSVSTEDTEDENDIYRFTSERSDTDNEELSESYGFTSEESDTDSEELPDVFLSTTEGSNTDSEELTETEIVSEDELSIERMRFSASTDENVELPPPALTFMEECTEDLNFRSPIGTSTKLEESTKHNNKTYLKSSSKNDDIPPKSKKLKRYIKSYSKKADIPPKSKKHNNKTYSKSYSKEADIPPSPKKIYENYITVRKLDDWRSCIAEAGSDTVDDISVPGSPLFSSTRIEMPSICNTEIETSSSGETDIISPTFMDENVNLRPPALALSMEECTADLNFDSPARTSTKLEEPKKHNNKTYFKSYSKKDDIPPKSENHNNKTCLKSYSKQADIPPSPKKLDINYIPLPKISDWGSCTAEVGSNCSADLEVVSQVGTTLETEEKITSKEILIKKRQLDIQSSDKVSKTWSFLHTSHSTAGNNPRSEKCARKCLENVSICPLSLKRTPFTEIEDLSSPPRNAKGFGDKSICSLAFRQFRSREK